MFSGASSNSADRASFGGEGCVRLSTIDGAWFEVRLVGRAVLSSTSAASKGRGFWGDGDSGENEGKEVSDLSEAAIEDAELDAYDCALRDRTLEVWDLRLLVEISEC